ncbi:hypothetical protein BDP27DRAFT_1368608 [Rhodocollybia butyracea]|uniref:Uncharacterized protein n=1 Tax=Rhodocollybia butyracea TaxID=206335 RepID=A0A9P5PF45_9AGAR|nr:hypothetical protein BDP27DRAFT_1368608 [Rhodocollybia butyracea]
MEYFYALHAFMSENDDEVPFRAGERIQVLEKDNSYGQEGGRVIPAKLRYTAPDLGSTSGTLQPLNEERSRSTRSSTFALSFFIPNQLKYLSLYPSPITAPQRHIWDSFIQTREKFTKPEITSDILLELNEVNVLKNEPGIKAFGNRPRIIHAIRADEATYAMLRSTGVPGPGTRVRSSSCGPSTCWSIATSPSELPLVADIGKGLDRGIPYALNAGGTVMETDLVERCREGFECNRHERKGNYAQRVGAAPGILELGITRSILWIIICHSTHRVAALANKNILELLTPKDQRPISRRSPYLTVEPARAWDQMPSFGQLFGFSSITPSGCGFAYVRPSFYSVLAQPVRYYFDSFALPVNAPASQTRIVVEEWQKNGKLLPRNGTCGKLQCICGNPAHARYSHYIQRKLIAEQNPHPPPDTDAYPDPEPEPQWELARAKAKAAKAEAKVKAKPSITKAKASSTKETAAKPAEKRKRRNVVYSSDSEDGEEDVGGGKRICTGSTGEPDDNGKESAENDGSKAGEDEEMDSGSLWGDNTDKESEAEDRGGWSGGLRERARSTRTRSSDGEEDDEMGYGGDRDDSGSVYSDDGERSESDDDGVFIPTVLHSRFKGHAPAPNKYMSYQNALGKWVFSLQESDGLFTYLHPQGSFTCSEHLPGRHDNYRDVSCAVVSWLGLSYEHTLDGFACATSHNMLGLQELKIFVNKPEFTKFFTITKEGPKHTAEGQLGARRLLTHLQSSFPKLLPDITAIVDRASKVLLSRPIPYLKPPIKTITCHFCHSELPSDQWRGHLRDGSKSCIRDDAQRALPKVHKVSRWSQSLLGGREKRQSRAFFVEDYHGVTYQSKSSARETAHHLPQSMQQERPPYLPENMWLFLISIEYRPTLSDIRQARGEGLDPTVLTDIVAPPLSVVKKYDEGTRDRKREEALVICANFFPLYLKHASTGVKDAHGFTKMLKKYSGLNYRIFKAESSYKTYGRVATDIISFMLRWRDSRRLTELIPLRMDEKLLKAFERLEKRVYANPSRVSLDTLSPLLHTIIIRLIRSPNPSLTKELTLIEHARVLCASTFLAMSNGGWRISYHLPVSSDTDGTGEKGNLDNTNGGLHNANGELDDAASGLDNTDDKLSDSESSEDTDSDDSSETESEDFSDQSEDSPESEPEDSMDESLALDPPDSSEDGPRPNLRDLVSVQAKTDNQFGNESKKALKQFLRKDRHTTRTVFGIIHEIWKEADSWSRAVKGHKTFRVHPCNLRFTYSINAKTKFEFPLTDFSKNYNLELEALQQAFKKLVPLSLQEKFLQSFAISNLFDDIRSHQSIFKQQQNKGYIGNFVEELKEQLWHTKTHGRDLANKDNIWNWIDDVEALQEHLIRGIFPTMGVTLRATQGGALSYDSSGSYIRCLRIIDGLVCLVGPLSKVDNDKQRRCFFSLKADMAWYLLFYLGVLRPVVISLIQEPVINNSAPVKDLEHYIFAKLGRLTQLRACYRFEGTEIDACLKANLLGLDTNSLRHVTTGILRHWRPDLDLPSERTDDPTSTSVLDLQGQHTSRVSRMHYARTPYMNATLFNKAELNAQLKVSHAMQNLDEVVRNGGKATQVQNINHVDALRRNGNLAWMKAKDFVMAKRPGYDIASGDEEDVQTRCEKLLIARPFLLGPKAKAPKGNWVAGWNTLGDQVLLEVSAALAKGYILEAPAAEIHVGYSAKLIAQAVYLICAAINEWSSGIHVPTNWESDPHREDRVSEIEGAILTFRRTKQERWTEFRGKLDTFLLSGPSPVALPGWSKAPFFNAGLFDAVEPDSDPEKAADDTPEKTADLGAILDRQIEDEREANHQMVLAAQRDETELHRKRKEEKEKHRKEKKERKEQKEKRKAKVAEKKGKGLDQNVPESSKSAGKRRRAEENPRRTNEAEGGNSPKRRRLQDLATQ